MKKLIALLALLFGVSASPAIALDCNAAFIDDAHVISDPGKVQAAARRLGDTTGSVVKVITFASLDTSLEKTLDRERHNCPSWSNNRDHYRNDLLIVAYAKPNQLAAVYGIDAQPVLGNKRWQDAMRRFLVPAISKMKAGDADAMTSGFIATLDAYQAQLTRPAGSTAPISIKQATDLSGLWAAMKWLLLILCVAGGGYAAALYFGQKAKRSAAQANARRVRSICVSKLNDLSDKIVLFEAKASNDDALKPLVQRYKSIVNRENASLHLFDAGGEEDPNAAPSSIEVYRSNQERYEGIIASLGPAEDLARQIETGRPDDIRPVPREDSSQTSKEAPPAADGQDRYPRPDPAVNRPGWPSPEREQPFRETQAQPASEWSRRSPSEPYVPPPPPPPPSYPYAAPYAAPTRDSTFQDAFMGSMIANELTHGHDSDFRRRDDDYRRQDDIRGSDNLQRTVDAEDDRREDAIDAGRQDADDSDRGGSFMADVDNSDKDDGGSFSADESPSDNSSPDDGGGSFGSDD